MSRTVKPTLVRTLALLSLVLVAASSNESCELEDPESTPSSPSGGSLAVHYDANRAVSVGTSFHVWSTDSAGNWVERSYDCCDALFAITYGPGGWIVAGDHGVSYTSSDGVHWHLGILPTGRTLRGGAYGANRYVFAGAGGRILSSSETRRWRTVKSHTNLDLEDVVFADDLFVVVGDAGTILTSPDGRSWTREDSGVTADLHGVGWGNGLFVAVGREGTILTSPDAAIWTVVAGPTGANLEDVAFGEGTFVVVGSQTLLYSTDGVSFQRATITSGSPISFQGATFGNGTFYAVGHSQRVFLSSDGVVWR